MKGSCVKSGGVGRGLGSKRGEIGGDRWRGGLGFFHLRFSIWEAKRDASVEMDFHICEFEFEFESFGFRSEWGVYIEVEERGANPLILGN